MNNYKKTMCKLYFTNTEIIQVHLWNRIDINNALKNN